jgi:hypothetical protein
MSPSKRLFWHSNNRIPDILSYFFPIFNIGQFRVPGKLFKSIKWPSLQERVSIFTPQIFFRDYLLGPVVLNFLQL